MKSYLCCSIKSAPIPLSNRLSINQRLYGKAQSQITFLFFAIARLKPGHLGFTWFSFLAHNASNTTILAEALPLAINILVTACIDYLGFIHTASLRWSLHRENQLQFNSNLRLFTGTRKFGPNSRVGNAFSACCHIICYTGGSQILVSGSINTISLFFISVGLAGQAFCLLGVCFQVLARFSHGARTLSIQHLFASITVWHIIQDDVLCLHPLRSTKRNLRQLPL